MSHSYPLLVDFLILLAVSIPVSFVFQKMKLPSIIGFLVTGMIVGPFGAGLVSEIEAVRALAEIGVVLLLFTIGLEFSFHHLFGAGPKLLFLGLAQVCLTILVSILVSRTFGISLNEGVILGFLFALSSTAIVLKVLSDRSELSAPHGKIALGILIFQDLAVIPMILLIPTLGGSNIEAWHILKQLGLAIATIAALILTGKYLVPLLLSQVLQFQNREIFLLTILFLCLGTAYVGASMGLSLALGAFIAGLVISESKYSHQILADILPFRDTFNAIFFISVGMLLNLPSVIVDWRFNLMFAGAVLVGKAFLILVVLLAARYTFRISWLAAFALAQVGEFSFLIAEQSKSFQILPQNIYQLFLSSSVLTMFFTPFAILFASKSGMKLQEIAGFKDVKEAPEEPKVSDHLIIIGYGLNGRNLASVVREIGIPFVVVELNAELVNQAVQQGVPVLFGDATRTDVLRRAGVERARMVVIAISDPAATRRAVLMIRDLNPSCVILVRTRYLAEVDSLMQLGANFVIPEEFETSIEIFARVLEQYNVPEHLIEQQIAVIRAESYGMLRGLSLSHERLLKLSELFLKSTVQQVVVGAASLAANRSVRELDLRNKTGATIIAVIRSNTVITNPGADFVLQQNDILVLWGDHQQLVEAERMLNPVP